MAHLIGATLEIVGMGVEGEVSLNQKASWIAVTLKSHAILNMHEGGVGGGIIRGRGEGEGLFMNT